MKRRKLQSLIIVLIITVSMMGIGLLSGCTSNTNNVNNLTPNKPVLSTTDSAILHNAYDEYDALKETVSFEVARTQLLDNLRNETGVESVELGLDMYTIFITFSDGGFAAVDTFEPEEKMTGIEGVVYLANHHVQNNNDGEKPVLAFDARYDELPHPNMIVTPQSKKVLILSLSYWKFDHDAIDKCIKDFKDMGWAGDDITSLLVKKSPKTDDNDCLKIMSDDYFNIEDYGIILYDGINAVKVYKNFNQDNMYLQFCYLDDASFASEPQLQEWKNEKKLLIFGCDTCTIQGVSHTIYSTAIRLDVLSDQMAMLPDSYVYMNSCFSAYIKTPYLMNGADVFLGWTSRVTKSIADSNLMTMNDLVTRKNYCVYNAYHNESIIKSYETSCEFNLYPDPEQYSWVKYLYLPAWIDVKVSGISNLATGLKINMWENNKITTIEEKQISGETQMELKNIGSILFPPGKILQIELIVFGNGNQWLATSKTNSTVLMVGKNYLSLSGKSYRWCLCGGDDPNTSIDTDVSVVVEVNGVDVESKVERPGHFFYFFNALPGHSLKIMALEFPITNRSYYLGPIWLHSCSTDLKMQLTSYMDFGMCTEYPPPSLTIYYEHNFTIPEI